MRRAPHDPRADRVERPHPHPDRLFAELARDTLAHLARRLVRERHGEDPLRVHTLLADEARDAGGEHARLS